ncbi:MAG: efflux RND transporter periplasmic adaptor subunit [Cyclobacteriaceae bacterium]|nr:efflux RND transporter periplasmic adaptor subunit [Cyclobacteriaceae bacterium]MCB0499185.1 efflux RND transporter periplasmic adaptor subunit [Cyclobacteriaceae bacterium]MCB9237975.1 efflux RND transporter periplasmic adaptor subunit [Flammeovirgaceae bacterium]MCO5271875.1 efflux RND transporter periplasmic adaptor subunit [Cyclobacteriaceae bacterium]MCW5901701.1 efflux RND transporter periplasmic adaptor subunit [Cyclobacteriaceae bacterium]
MNKTALLMGAVALMALARCTSSKEANDDIGKFTVTSPMLMDTSYTREYVTQIQSLQNVELRAMVKGYIQTINVDEGQLVKLGQVLFTIMPAEYEAELQKAKAEAKTAELEWENTKTLAEKSIVSQTELAIAQAKLDQAKAEVALAELYLSFTKVKAPFDGVIDRIRFKIGSLIDEGTLLTTLSNNKEVYAYFNVSESEYLEYKTRNDEGAKVRLLLANNQLHPYQGTIETIEGEFDNNTGNIAFRARFPNPDLLLKHGETGKILMTIPIRHALIIPQKATFDIQGRVYVYVVDKNNVVKAKSITVSQTLPNIYVVGPGLSENDKILLEGLQSVKDDDKVLTYYVPPREVLGKLQLITPQ